MKPYWMLLLFCCFSIFSYCQNEQPNDSTTTCNQLMQEKLTFLSDGSLTKERVLVESMTKLKSCGLDKFDITFFGNMDVFSSIASRMIKSKDVSILTYQDLFNEINKFKKAPVYQEIRQVTLASEALGEKTGSLKTWKADLLLFKDLGASKKVIEKVTAYLTQHPSNTMTYKEILEKIKK